MISVRRIEASERPLCREVRLRALQDSPDSFGSTYALEQARPDHVWAARLSDAVGSSKDAPLFAVNGDQVCGLAWCMFDSTESGRVNLFQMWVAPEFRRRGVGRELVSAAIDWAKRSGARRMHLDVTVGDSPASRLYSRLGFVLLEEYEPLREGTSLMSTAMELDLSAA